MTEKLTETLVNLWKNNYYWADYKGQWMKWTGKRWQEFPDCVAVGDASRTLRDYYEGKMRTATTFAEAEELDSLITKASKITTLKNIVSHIKKYPGIFTTPDQWDSDGWLLNVNNGTIDLRTGKLRPHNPKDMCTHLAPVDYDSTAVGPVWEEHIRLAIPDENIRRQLQRDLGMSLIGTCTEKILPIWFDIHLDEDKNGWDMRESIKRIVAKTITGVLGSYAGRTAPNIPGERCEPGYLLDLKGKRIIFSQDEITDGYFLDEAKTKKITGKDRIRARHIRRKFFEFDKTWTIFLLYYEKPYVTCTKLHEQNVRLIPWTITEHINQYELTNQLSEEGPAILKWMLEGLADWRENPGWTAKETTVSALNYKEKKSITNFIEECCEPCPNGIVSIKDLYETYLEWCQARDYTPLTKQSFGKDLQNRFERIRQNGKRCWKGLKLKRQ